MKAEMAFCCRFCGTQMPENAAFCPVCGKPIAENPAPEPYPSAAGTTNTFIPENIAGALAYFTFIPAIVFLFVEPFSKNRFIRFHSLQCVLLSIALGALGLLLRISIAILSLVPILGRLVALLLLLIVLLGCFILWFVLVIKAFQGEKFKLPLLGDWAERQATTTVV